MSKSVAKEFWTAQKSYPEYGTIKQRRLHELQYLVPRLSGDSLLDLGCGDGALLNCLVELTDFNQYHGYDFATHLIKNLNNKVQTRNFNVYEDNLNTLPAVDNIICAGMLPFIFEDEVIEKIYASLNTKKLFLRTPCTLKNEDEYVNVYSDKLKSNYSSKYRTVSNVLKTLEKHFIVESIDRVYPDEIESEFDTKQFYFCGRSKK
jgi:cyclopropane fatty-acyl-phospholipid synthase-like methyltransferase